MASLLVFDVDAERAGGSPHPDEDRIGDGEPLGRALRRICVTRVGRAIDDLAVAPGDRDAGVHSARKSLKRVRAVIRLVRDPVGRRPYREVNVVLRDCARRLAPVRDGAVMVEVVDRLGERHGLDQGLVAHTRGLLAAAHAEARRAVLADEAAFAHTMTSLRTVRRRFAAWPVDDPASPLAVGDEFASIATGLQRVYRRGRRALERCEGLGTEAAFHEWRKRVKYLRHQMEALHNAWPEVIGATAAALEALGEVLGEEHDHAVFRSMLEDGGIREAERALLGALAAAEQARLRGEALRLGHRLYAEPPGRFVDRIGSYWEAWRGDPAHPAQGGSAPGR